jgi:hypothetical protein
MMENLYSKCWNNIKNKIWEDSWKHYL